MERKLTKSVIDELSCPDGKERVYYQDSELRSLSLCVTKNGTKTYYRCGRIRGKYKRVLIARVGEITLKRAREVCREISGDIAAGRPPVRIEPPKSQRTLKDLFDWYIEHYAKRNKSSWKKDVQKWKYLASHADTPIDELTRQDAKEIVHNALDSGAGIAYLVRALLRGMYNQAIDNEWIDKNPATRIKIPKYNERTRHLSEQELKRFLKVVNKSRSKFRDAILLALYTGARRSNILSMRWDELDLGSAVWIIPAEKAKSSKEIRVPLVQQSLDILKNRKQSSEYVFPSWGSTGHLMSPKHAMTEILDEAGITDFVFHDLRHTFATYQDKSGSPIQHIQRSLAHATPGQTAKYAHTSEESARISMQAAADMMKLSEK